MWPLAVHATHLSLHGAQILAGVAHVALRHLLHLLEDADGTRHLHARWMDKWLYHRLPAAFGAMHSANLRALLGGH